MKTLQKLILGLSLLLPVQAFAMENDDPMLLYVGVDELATTGTDTEWKVNAWLGYDLNKLYVKSDGLATAGAVSETSTQLLFSHAVSPFWDIQYGLRVDNKAGNQRNYAGIGYMGTAPYFLGTEAFLYYGDNGQVNLHLNLEYELMFTQRLALISEFGMEAYSQDDVAQEIGSGLSSTRLGFRLAYELRREFAPYVGVSFNNAYGNTASYIVGGGGEAHSVEYSVGLKMWF